MSPSPASEYRFSSSTTSTLAYAMEPKARPDSSSTASLGKAPSSRRNRGADEDDDGGDKLGQLPQWTELDKTAVTGNSSSGQPLQRSTSVLEELGRVAPWIAPPLPESEIAEFGPAPDGGLEAWTVVLGSYCCLMTVFGLMASYGAFNSYYQLHVRGNISAIAGIGSLQAGVSQIGSIISGPVFDRHGPRLCLSIGGALLFAGLICTSLCTELWQLFLAQGLLVGMGMCWLFVVPLACVSQWFDKKKGLAIGIAISGPSLGAIIWPLMIAYLPEKIGWGNTVRVIACCSLALVTFAFFTIKARLPQKKGRRALLNFPAFKKPEFVCLTLGGATFSFSFFFFIYFIQTFTRIKLGESSSFAPLSLILTNGCSGIGRVVIGLTSDKTGRFNTIAACMGISAIAMYAWLACDTLPSIIILCMVFGFFSGGFASLQIVCVAELTEDIQLLGTNSGMTIAFGGLFLFGASVSGVLLGDSPATNFPKAIALNGAMLAVTSVLFFTSRMIVWNRRGRTSWVI